MNVKKILFFAIIVVSLFVINSLVHSIIALWQKNSLIVSAKKDLKKQEGENKELKKRLAEVKKPEFVEEEARNKLFLSKSGEGIIVMPTDYLSASGSGKAQTQDNRPNWRQWWETFF